MENGYRALAVWVVLYVNIETGLANRFMVRYECRVKNSGHEKYVLVHDYKRTNRERGLKEAIFELEGQITILQLEDMQETNRNSNNFGHTH